MKRSSVSSTTTCFFVLAQESILEKHHWYVTRSLLHETQLFGHARMTALIEPLYGRAEDMILVTDMSQHASFMSQMQSFRQPTGSLTLSPTSSELEKRLALRLSLKCADVSNPTRIWPQCRAWAELIVEEFFAQGDAERSAGRACSAFMNRHSDHLTDIQIGFFNFVIQPLFGLWNGWLQSALSSRVNQHMLLNLSHWQDWQGRDRAAQSAAPIGTELSR